MAFTIAFRLMENREEAEEVVQDAFVKAYQGLGSFSFGSKFSTWFYRIVYRTAISALRGRHDFADYDEATPAELTVEERESAAALLEGRDRQAVIREALRQLPREESLLLTLFYLEECSVEEIHQITGLTPTNIKTRLFRGRKHLYETLHTMHLTKKDLL